VCRRKDTILFTYFFMVPSEVIIAITLVQIYKKKYTFLLKKINTFILADGKPIP